MEAKMHFTYRATVSWLVDYKLSSWKQCRPMLTSHVCGDAYIWLTIPLFHDHIFCLVPHTHPLRTLTCLRMCGFSRVRASHIFSRAWKKFYLSIILKPNPPSALMREMVMVVIMTLKVSVAVIVMSEWRPWWRRRRLEWQRWWWRWWG